ncbi:fasciclin domain-containing protein [Nocardioides donggukensis]|uniref:Fasciclin domain-containing protein n=1 Tax=Nocardioides donggukensis TaxID=2774019 RepID=A0A927K758_9ACTN|nr:fasciclin domain-containing protein [Nocardioides donggukensis]MBD8871176.1 fasciclin domain-containing protein [Nocardioides donggukensis]
MKRTILRQSGAAAAVLALSVTLAACGSDDESSNSAGEDTSSESEAPTSEEPAADDAGAQTFGEGCSLIPDDGAGSFNGMATEPVATAASGNPLLKTLVTAVGEAGLVDTLNSAEALTVFAPTDDAFAKIPEKDLNAVLADKELLTQILTGHVVAGQLGPDELSGELETLAGNTIEVKGSDESFTVADEEANVLCGNIPTSNATVYVIDTVLMP